MPEQTSSSTFEHVAIVFPFRESGHIRDKHLIYVRKQLEGMLPGAGVILADSGHDRFNRAASRNVGVAEARDKGYEVVIINDVDTLPEEIPLREAVAGASDGRLHLPYNYFRGLTKQSTKRFVKGYNRLQLEIQDEGSFSTGGVLVLTVDAYERTGGQDDRCVGWGFEDTIFRVIVDAILGDTVRHQGTIWHLWHPEDWNLGSPEWQANADLCADYNEAEGDPQKVMKLIQDRHS